MSTTVLPPAPPAKLKKLAPPRPSPAGARPVRAKSQLPVLNLIYVPRRIFVPPKPSVCSVRSFKSTPLSDIRLEGVLANKYLSPLDLKSFEGHLVYKTRDAENLYFVLWLNEYTKEYASYMSDSSIVKPTFDSSNPETLKSHFLPDYLSESLQRGLDVFFAPNAPLELNLSAATREKTLIDGSNSASPATFTEAREIIERSLEHSLARFCRDSIANAGPRRLDFCFCLGLSIFLLSLIPFFFAIFAHHARAWRAIGLPFMAFGFAVMAMALQKIWGVIWLLGEDRQMQWWELVSPPLASGSIVYLPSSPRSLSSYDDESAYSEDDSFRSAQSWDPYPWEKEDSYAPSSNRAPGSTASLHPTPVSSRPPSYAKGTPLDLVPDSPPRLQAHHQVVLA